VQTTVFTETTCNLKSSPTRRRLLCRASQVYCEQTRDYLCANGLPFSNLRRSAGNSTVSRILRSRAQQYCCFRRFSDADPAAHGAVPYNVPDSWRFELTPPWQDELGA
jgi:hypothetical protein